MTASAPGRHLEWDSEFFGRRIARVAAARLTPAELGRVLAWAEAESVDCLYYLADASDAGSIRSAEDGGFRLTDVRVTRARSLAGEGGALPDGIELSREEDLPALRAIARASHGTTRFYQDPNFPRERCHALYETWIEKSCRGMADGVLVARAGGSAAGYLSCVLEPDGLGAIGLVAVSQEHRRQGLGEKLVRGALAWFAGSGCASAQVVSQARNVPAARLFEGTGFRTHTVEHWYHRWRSDAAPGDVA